jgi:hypothetical protein
MPLSIEIGLFSRLVQNVHEGSRYFASGPASFICSSHSSRRLSRRRCAAKAIAAGLCDRVICDRVICELIRSADRPHDAATPAGVAIGPYADVSMLLIFVVSR